jgi:NitT/TauT family transport system substrate-binding protein
MFEAARRFFHGAVVLLSLTGAVGSAQAEPVRVGNINTVSDIAIFLADKKGYFKSEGLVIEFTPFTTAAQMVAPLGVGRLDVGGGTISAGLYNANARAIGIKIVADKGSGAPGYTFSSLLIRKDLIDSGAFKTLKDLKGLKIAIVAPGTGNASKLNQALLKGGLTWADAQAVPLPFPQHYTAYANKAIDGGITNEPTSSLAIRAGLAVRVPNDDDIYPYAQTAALFYSSEFATKRPQEAQKFMRAYIRAARDYNDSLKGGRIAGLNAEDVIATLVQYSEIKDEKLLRETTPNACNPDGTVNMASLETDFAFFKEQKLIESPDIKVADVVDMSFAQKAVAELGPYKSKN